MRNYGRNHFSRFQYVQADHRYISRPYQRLVVDVQLSYVTIDVEFETNRVGFYNYIRLQYVQADHCNMSRRKRSPTRYQSVLIIGLKDILSPKKTVIKQR